ncbi:MAG: hypothetical protein IPG71_00330 [bacterium]|nr:hypothetical protein [bacterium]
MNAHPKRGRPRTIVRVKARNYPLDFRAARREFVTQYVQTVLDDFGGNVSATARALGLSRRSVQILLAEREHRATLAHGSRNIRS